ncbi:MAG: hypothetical protein JO069_18310 [Verrucomicrobia bacterium]|nr:hypothetical protein [Verrucomicrobiota bacterium]
MRHTPYQWLNAYLDAHLAELKGVTASPQGRAKARRWFKALTAHFKSRRLTTERQQKGYLVQVRNAIRRAFGPDHPSLEVVRFDEATWVDINAASHGRVEERLQNTRFLTDPDAIVARAEALLTDKKSIWADLAVGLAVATGRRISELLGIKTRLELKTAYSVRFTGQLKRRQDGSGEPFTFEIPTLVPAATALEAWQRLRFMLGAERLSPRDINQRFGRGCREAANRHFADLIPAREGKDDLYMHLFRAVYATIAVHYYCPARVNPTLFKAEIQGHRMIAAAGENSQERRSYTASRHYDDYAIADAHGNRDGRQGTRLGAPGVEPLEVFRDSAAFKATPTATPMPVTQPSRNTRPQGAAPARRAAKPTKMPKPIPPPRAQSWRVSEAAQRTLSRDWKGSAEEPQARVLDRVLAFAGAARDLARHLDLSAEQLAPETLLSALAERYRARHDEAKDALGRLEAAEAQGRAQQAADQHKQRKLQQRIEELDAERGSLLARIAGLQRQLQDAAVHTGPAFQLLPFARRLLELSQRSANLAPAQLQGELMQLATEAIARAEGLPGSAAASADSAPPAPPSAATPPSAEAREAALPPLAGAPPRVPPPTPVVTPPAASPQTQPEPAKEAAPADASERPDGEAPSAPDLEGGPAHRHSAKADEKLEKALRYLTDINEVAEERGQKWCVTEGLLFDLTGCFRPAVKRFVAAHRDRIEELNRRHGIGLGHNRGRSRMRPNALPELIKTFRESVLNPSGIEQPF